MEKRPKIKPEFDSIDKMVELAGLLTVLGLWGFTFINYPDLPATIPTHFNAKGVADDFGAKSSVFALPVVATIFYVGMTILNLFTQIFNYPVKITPENTLRQYGHATKLVRWMKLGLILVFFAIVVQTVQTAEGKAGGLGGWFLPLSLGLLFVPLVVFIFRMYQDK
jgi:uncharacterized membrane protein